MVEVHISSRADFKSVEHQTERVKERNSKLVILDKCVVSKLLQFFFYNLYTCTSSYQFPIPNVRFVGMAFRALHSAHTKPFDITNFHFEHVYKLFFNFRHGDAFTFLLNCLALPLSINYLNTCTYT